MPNLSRGSQRPSGRNRKSPRLRNWDYGSNAAYFITICTHGREHHFGHIKDGEMHLSPAGAIAHVLWAEITTHAKNVQLGEFVVMPNHVHGILILVGVGGRDVACNVPTTNVACNVPTTNVACNVPTTDKNEQMSAISPKPNTVSAIVRSYKSAVTKYCNRLGLPNGWQSRYHDRIIRDKQAFVRISEYIRNNPSKWDDDQFNNPRL